jgi:lipopolysaccharide transport system permease protein
MAIQADLAPVVIYTADHSRKNGVKVWPKMFSSIFGARELVWRLFVRSWSAQYRQSWLGYAWAVMPPVVAVLTFSFLVQKRVVAIGETPIPYVAYALWGLCMWQLFTGCYASVAKSLVNAGPMIARINFSKDALAFASVGRPMFDFMVRLAVVGIVLPCLGVVPKWTVVFLPVVVFPLILMAVGLGMIMAVISVAGTDVATMAGMALNFGILVTPVMYPPLQTWPYTLLSVLNPVSPVVIAGHDILETGMLTMPGPYIMSCVFSVLLFAVGWRFFCLSIPRIAERF